MKTKQFALWFDIIIVVFQAAEEPGPPFRGGRIAKRDRWFGLKGREGFDDFREWWHRRGKDEYGGHDIRDKAMAEEVYAAWYATHRSLKGR